MPRVIDTDRLFETTVRLFAERGYSGTTTQEVAREAGVNEVTLFRRYTNKSGLIVAALSLGLSRAPLREVAASEDVQADLAAIVVAFQETNRAYGGAVVTLLYELPRHPELQDVVSILQSNMGSAAQVIASHQARGALRPGSPIQQVMLLLAPLASRSGGVVVARRDGLVAAARDCAVAAAGGAAGDGAVAVSGEAADALCTSACSPARRASSSSPRPLSGDVIAELASMSATTSPRRGPAAAGGFDMAWGRAGHGPAGARPRAGSCRRSR
ncbi:MAG: AcrR family transcriptional regulator [Myxococcota bacterium]|jgi:AcrR family transcriptional regulator